VIQLKFLRICFKSNDKEVTIDNLDNPVFIVTVNDFGQEPDVIRAKAMPPGNCDYRRTVNAVMSNTINCSLMSVHNWARPGFALPYIPPRHFSVYIFLNLYLRYNRCDNIYNKLFSFILYLNLDI